MRDTYAEINRNNFGTSTVFALLKSNALSKAEALRLLEEATHVIAWLRDEQNQTKQALKPLIYLYHDSQG